MHVRADITPVFSKGSPLERGRIREDDRLRLLLLPEPLDRFRRYPRIVKATPNREKHLIMNADVIPSADGGAYSCFLANAGQTNNHLNGAKVSQFNAFCRSHPSDCGRARRYDGLCVIR